MIITPITEIDAVNEILSSVGDSPVNTIEEPKNVNVINAIRILRITNRKQQARAWPFNTYHNYTLNPDVTNNRIRFIDTFLIVTGNDGTTYNKRGEYLYNPRTQTDIFTEPIVATVVMLLPFIDLPDQMRHYITAKAAADFQIRYLGDPSLGEALSQDEAEAWAALQEYELEQGQYNALTNIAVMRLRRR